MLRSGTSHLFALVCLLALAPACGPNSHDDDDNGDGDGGTDGGGDCVDIDGDGWGQGPDCSGDDCDEGNPARQSGCGEDCEALPADVGCPCDADQPTACFDGEASLVGVGPCTTGLEQCTGGVWGACFGQRLPLDEDPFGRNDVDDDCNGLVDDRLCGDGDDCGGQCCETGEVCLGTSCGPPADCAVDGNCDDDTHCTGDGCVPYGAGETNPDCDGDIVDPIDPLDSFEPDLQCEWLGDADLRNVMTPGLVVELDPVIDDALHPEIVFTAFGASYNARLVAIDGETCEERWRADDAEGQLQIEAPPSAGDVDGDGHVEIAAPTSGGGVALFDDEGAQLWRTDSGEGFSSWSPTLIANLDGQGDAEILRSLTVYDSAGDVLWSAENGLVGFVGQVSVVADVDLDGEQEVVTGNLILNGADGGEEESFPQLSDGFTAVADFDKSTPQPEIAVVATDGTRIQTITGEIIFGPYDAVLGQSFFGGPPVIGDFDNDGEAEFGSAGGSAYVVFDPDCTNDWARDGECASGNDDGVLWTKQTQDFSSGVTGSSVFDFDFDGVNEVVYNDECFTRVYDGLTGDTRWIRTNSTATGFEYPIIADADGDGRTEIVVPANDLIGSCPNDPDTGEVFSGATYGLQVWRDVEDRWAASRRIWNQHAYSVTNVLEGGGIPQAPENNWQVVGLNNFRVNTRDDPASAERGVDLTVRGQPSDEALCPEAVTVRALVANRGIHRAPRGVSVAFFGIDPDTSVEVLACEARTEQDLEPGATELVSCDWLEPPSLPWRVHVFVDSTEALVECEEANNDATIDEAYCEGIE
jgi:hypothetical protein